MTREHKLSLIIGFAVVLIVGVLISDHLSGARQAALDETDPGPILDTSFDDAHLSSELALVNDRGEIEPAVDTISAAPESALASAGDAAPERDEPQSGLEWIRDQARGVFSGPTPPVAAQTDGVQTLDMGEGYRRSRQESPRLDPDAEFDIYIVRPGESLWSIAEDQLGSGQRYREIERLNQDRLAASGLRPGLNLRLPIAPGALQPEAEPEDPRDAPAPVATTSLPTSRAEATTYTVKKGDTLSEISQEMLGTIKRMDEIIEANSDKLDDANDIRVGMVLTIPAR